MGVGTVTVCIPAWNREELLPDAMRSVFVQTYPDWELWVYDDGSVDDTYDVAKQLIEQAHLLSPKVHIVRSAQHLGHGAARAWFRDSVQTEWMTWLDSDDLMDPRRLERQVAAAEAYDLDCCFCWIKRFRTGEDPRHSKRFRRIDVSRWGLDVMGFNNNTNTATGLFNSRGRHALRGWIPDHGNYDVLWHSRMVLDELRVGCVEEPLYILRDHRGRMVNWKRDQALGPRRAEEQVRIKEELRRMGMYLG